MVTNDKQAMRDGFSRIVRNDLADKVYKSKKLQGGVEWFRRMFFTYFKANVGVLTWFFSKCCNFARFYQI